MGIQHYMGIVRSTDDSPRCMGQGEQDSVVYIRGHKMDRGYTFPVGLACLHSRADKVGRVAQAEPAPGQYFLREWGQ
jgi:hypothetical protein